MIIPGNGHRRIVAGEILEMIRYIHGKLRYSRSMHYGEEVITAE